MNLAAWIAAYLSMVLGSVVIGFFFGWNCGDYAREVWPNGVDVGVDLDELDRPTKGTGEL